MLSMTSIDKSTPIYSILPAEALDPNEALQAGRSKPYHAPGDYPRLPWSLQVSKKMRMKPRVYRRASAFEPVFVS